MEEVNKQEENNKKEEEDTHMEKEKEDEEEEDSDIVITPAPIGTSGGLYTPASPRPKPGGFGINFMSNAPEPISTPSGIRFVADLPLRKNELGYEYVHLFLEEQEEVTSLETLFFEIDYSHMVWEVRRGNVLLLEALTEETFIDELLVQVYNNGRDYPPSSAPLSGEVALKYTASSIDLLTWEAKNGLLYGNNESALNKIVSFLYSHFLESPDKPFNSPPRQISSITEILSFNPKTRDKVIGYLIKTDAENFVRSLVRHLDDTSVFNLVLTLTALLSPCPPLAAQPPNQLKFRMKRHSTSYGTNPTLATHFNEWLSKGGFIPSILAALLQTEGPASDMTENAAAVLMEILSVAERQISKDLDPPLLLNDLMEESSLTKFISSVFSHQETKVLAEGVAVFEQMLVYDNTRRYRAKLRQQESSEQDTTTNNTSTSTSTKEEGGGGMDPAHALLSIIQLNVNLLFARIGLEDIVLRYKEEAEKEKENTSSPSTTAPTTATTTTPTTTPATPSKRFGLVRLRLLEFVEKLLSHVLSEHVLETDACTKFLEFLRQHKFWQLLMDAIIAYPRNNLLHIGITQIISILFSSNQQQVQVEVLTEDKLLDNIVKASAINSQSELKGAGFREPFMGAITEISITLQKAAQRDPLIDSVLAAHEGWKEYSDGALRRIVAIHNRERDPVEERRQPVFSSIPLALLAKIFASQTAAQQKDKQEEEEEEDDLIEELLVREEETETDISKKHHEEEDNDHDNDTEEEATIAIVTGDDDDVIIHLTEEELAQRQAAEEEEEEGKKEAD